LNANSKVASTKVATTSTYNYVLDFQKNSAAGTFNNQNFSYRGMNVINWLFPYIYGGKSLVDYINVHTYPYYLTRDMSFNDPRKATALLACSDLLDKDILPEVKKAIKALGLESQVEIVITEGNTGWCEGNTCNEKDPLAQPRTMTEAMFFADHFITAAKHNLKAFIPFAFMKQGIYYGASEFEIVNMDPSDPASWFIVREDPQQNIHFYPNSGNFPAAYVHKNELFYRPTFKAKKMIYQGLGDQLIGSKNYSVKNASQLDVLYYPYTSGKIDAIAVLPTLRVSNTNNSAYILIVNRNQTEDEWVSLKIDDIVITSGDLMYFQGGSHEKQIPYSDAAIGSVIQIGSNPVSFNHGFPVYQPVTVNNGRIKIPKFSICILKVALSPRATLTCQNPPTASATSCSSIAVTIPSQLHNNSTVTSAGYGVYYYERLDVQSVPEPTIFDPNDPNWVHFGDFPPVIPPATSFTQMITGLRFSQDNYQIAVVQRYQYMSPKFIGPLLDSVSCVATDINGVTDIKTLSCETQYCKPNSGFKEVTASSVTSAIGLTQIEPTTTASVTPQKLYISSPIFTVDDSYTFFGSEIYCAANTIISVAQGQTLNVIETSMAGCDFLWDGIKAGSVDTRITIKDATIRDTRYGLSYPVITGSGAKPVFDVTGTNFFRNRTSIKIDGDATSTSTVDISPSSRFFEVFIDGTEYNLKPVLGSSAIERAQVGIEIGDTRTSLYFGKMGTTRDGVTIQNVRNPVVSEGCKGITTFLGLNIDNSNFVTFTSSGLTDDEPLVKAQNGNGLVISNSFNRNWMLAKHSKSAILSSEKTLSVTGTLTRGADAGVIGIGNTPLNLIIGNEFHVNSTGVTLSGSGGLKVNENTVIFNNNPLNAPTGTPSAHNGSTQGIQIVSLVPVTYADNQNQIYNNFIWAQAKYWPNQATSQGIATGVSIWNASRLRIERNTVNLQNDNPHLQEPRFYGIYKMNGSKNTICSNEVTGMEGLDRGIGSFFSPGNIQCNKVLYTKQALYFEADNDNANAITSNLLGASQYGTYVNNNGSITTRLGQQFRQENTWPNNWSAGGFWNGNPANIPFSKFINYSPYPYYPLLVTPATGWFERNSDFEPNPACQNPGIQNQNCPVPPTVTPPGGGEPGREVRGLAASYQSLEEPYKSMIVRRELARIEEEYPDVISRPSELQNFSNLWVNSPMDHLRQVDQLLANPLLDLLGLAQNQQDLANQIQDLMPDVHQHYDWLYNLSDAEYEQYLLSGQMAPTVIQFEQLNSVFAAVNQEATDVVAQKLTDAKNLNSAIQEANQYVSLEKKMNDLVIQSLSAAAGINPFTTNEWGLINSTALLCPQDWGDGVLKARSLWLRYGGSFERTWQDCFPVHSDTGENLPNSSKATFQSSKDTAFMNLELSAITLYPVPVSELLTIFVPEEYVGATYQIVSSTGIMLEQGVMNARIRQISTVNFSNGLHFVHIRAHDKRPANAKFIVQKH
jgi:hypothetical protein